MDIKITACHYEPAHLPALVSFFCQHFGKEDKRASSDYWEWLCAGNPVGSPLIVKALSGHRWLGCMTLVPIKLIKNLELVLAYYVINVLVDPAARGQKIFANMIEASVLKVSELKSSLIGHPNQAAIGSWHRAGMHFHESLSPHLLVPFTGTALGRQEVEDPKIISELITVNSKNYWAPLLTAEYLRWRYLRNPFGEYTIGIANLKSNPVGFFICKRIRPFLNLWIYSGGLDPWSAHMANQCPLLTAAFAPHAFTSSWPALALRTPVRKPMPFFWTNLEQPIVSESTIALGLSPSDF